MSPRFEYLLSNGVPVLQPAQHIFRNAECALAASIANALLVAVDAYSRLVLEHASTVHRERPSNWAASLTLYSRCAGRIGCERRCITSCFDSRDSLESCLDTGAPCQWNSPIVSIDLLARYW